MKVSQSKFIAQVAVFSGKTEETVKTVLDAIQDSITYNLKSGIATVLSPSLGIIEPTYREARDGRNPSTGKAMKIAASNSAKLKVSKALKEALN